MLGKKVWLPKDPDALEALGGEALRKDVSARGKTRG